MGGRVLKDRGGAATTPPEKGLCKSNKRKKKKEIGCSNPRWKVCEQQNSSDHKKGGERSRRTRPNPHGDLRCWCNSVLDGKER